MMANTQPRKRQSRNAQILKQMTWVVDFLAGQDLPLRGGTETLESLQNAENNPGNVLALLKELFLTDPVLQEHLESPRLRNATCLSPRIQTEIIGVISDDLLLADLVDEVKNSFSQSWQTR